MSDNDNLFFSGEIALLFSSSAAFTWKRALRQKFSYLQYIYMASWDILPNNLLMGLKWCTAVHAELNWTNTTQYSYSINIHIPSAHLHASYCKDCTESSMEDFSL